MSSRTSLQCPHCRTGLVHEPSWPNAVAACQTCGGVWLDNAATKTLLDRPDPSLIDFARGAGAVASTPSTDTGAKRPCAACGHAMVITQVTSSGVQVDVCSEHGTWFDRHELELLAKAVDAGVDVGSQDVAVAERATDGTQLLRWVLREVRGLFDRRA